MDRPKLTIEDLRRINTAAVLLDIEKLRRNVDSLGFVAPEDAEVWQLRLNRAAELMTAIADGLRLTPPRDQPLQPQPPRPRFRK